MLNVKMCTNINKHNYGLDKQFISLMHIKKDKSIIYYTVIHKCINIL